MIRRTVSIAFVGLTLIAAVGSLSAQKVDPALAMLEAARQKEAIEGDLKGAISQYESIVATYGKTNRPAAAQALLRMAECYQTLGERDRGRSLYEHVVREYADQAEVTAQANAQLRVSSNVVTRSPISHRLWSGSVNLQGSVSPDGRYLSFTDWETGDLALRDLAAGTNRRLTDKGTWNENGDWAQESVISPDTSEIVYAWYAQNLGRYQIRLKRLDSAPKAPTIILLDNPEIQYVVPTSWSPNGFVSVQLARVDRTSQLAMVNIKNGSLTVLRSLNWRDSSRAMFSPDGRSLAYDMPVGDDVSRQHDIHVIAVDGSADNAVVIHEADDTVVGWSPTGSHLLFARDAAGAQGVWSVPVKNGKPEGPSTTVLGALMPFSLGITRSGSLVYGLSVRSMQIFTAAVDFSTGQFTLPPKPVREGYRFQQRGPAWSADGRSLAYIAFSKPHRLTTFSPATGRLEDKQLQLEAFGQLRSISGAWMVCNCTDLKGRQGIYKLNAATGEVVPVVMTEGEGYSFPSMSRDERWVAYSRSRKTPDAMTADAIVRNLATGEERVLASDALMPVISPSGHHVAYVSRQQLHVVPITGGVARTLAPADASRAMVEWTPDERFVVTHHTIDGKSVATAVPVDGGAPIPLSLPADWRPMMFSIHPDGRQIAFSAGEAEAEVWIVENFLGKTTK